MSLVNIKGIDKVELLAALFNASRAQGAGLFAPHTQAMTKEEAQSLKPESTYFDYIRGRVMKIYLGDDECDTRLYDRDNGPGAAEVVINALHALRAEA